MKDKLIIKYAFKRVLSQIEFDSNLQMELLQIGVEYVKLTEREITEEPEYKDLFETLCKLAKV
jgi:hypothetical protein